MQKSTCYIIVIVINAATHTWKKLKAHPSGTPLSLNIHYMRKCTWDPLFNITRKPKVYCPESLSFFNLISFLKSKYNLSYNSFEFGFDFAHRLVAVPAIGLEFGLSHSYHCMLHLFWNKIVNIWVYINQVCTEFAKIDQWTHYLRTIFGYVYFYWPHG